MEIPQALWAAPAERACPGRGAGKPPLFPRLDIVPQSKALDEGMFCERAFVQVESHGLSW